MLKININQVPNLIELCKKSQNNLLIVGNPGVGKSQIVGSLENDHCKVTMLTGSSTYEETANGIPRDNKETKMQDYTRPEWFVNILNWAEEHNSDEDYQILFIDEFNTADPQVLKTFLSILTERKIPTQKEPLPKHLVMVAAMNPCSQNEGEELIRPMASRFITVEIESTIESYRKYITGEINEKDNIIVELLEEEKPLTTKQFESYLSQVVEQDWHGFEAGSYHEINPRSMSNFFRAMGFVKNRKQVSQKLSQAFFGKTYQYFDEEESEAQKEEKRKQKVKKGVVLPTYEDLVKMSTGDLIELKQQLLTKGPQGFNAVANIIKILADREEEK